jgi:hypothetical protein
MLASKGAIAQRLFHRRPPVFGRRTRLYTSLLTMSSVEGALDPPLSTSTLSEYFRSDILAKHASRPALICPQEQPRPHGGPESHNFNNYKYLAWDFQEFDRHIQALSRGLLAVGVKKGDRVGVVMGNTRSAMKDRTDLSLPLNRQLLWGTL